ncbi:potassium transporter TrkG [Ruminococcus sp. Marseille-P6503]|uniref:TrkH family potassium uptake protein n=1 Tax=Ruminococcus sp. Marseille-P6503 TaxID=2364796 RepID=UPI000F52782B|nr:potassium transporter TrkG [Ruminococcus sp. Marseille-P6503]
MFSKIKNFFQSVPLTKFLLLGYGIIILIGTLLLSLPVSTRDRVFTPIEDSLFTATSASCVTGLVIHDTYTYWSLFGQLVILFLIQIGGIGFMSVAIFALTLTKQKIGLKQRFTMLESVNAPQLGGIVKMTRFILFGSLTFEGIGAAVLSFRFIPELGVAKGVYFAVFHSVSAFCNAGIDLMGNFKEFSSLMTVDVDVMFNIAVMLLITTGGLGFFVWNDIREHKLAFRSYRLQTKIVLSTSFILSFGGAAVIMLLEYDSAAYEGMNFAEKFLCSMFQSVTTRTAGFSTVDLTQYSEAGLSVMSMLMLIGGSPGSTAGGIKTTTFAVLVLSIICVFKKKKSLECFKRRIVDDIVHNAVCIFMMYIILTAVVSVFICAFDNVSMLAAVFETSSAVGTVGLSLGLTPSLSSVSHILLALLMYVGRVGGLTVLMALSNSAQSSKSQLPTEKITVG